MKQLFLFSFIFLLKSKKLILSSYLILNTNKISFNDLHKKQSFITIYSIMNNFQLASVKIVDKKKSFFEENFSSF